MERPDFDLAGQVALVTGAGRGIGRDLARALAACGALVLGGVREPESADVEWAAPDGGLVTPLRLDVTDVAATRAAIDTANAPSAVFDFGYLVETYKEATFLFSQPVKGLDAIDGYQLVLKAAALQNDPAIQFAAAVITQGKTALRAEYRDHLQRAIAGAKGDAALNASVTKHFRDTGEFR